MDNREVTFRDFISLPNSKALFSDSLQLLEDLHGLNGISPNLQVTIKATHSGYLLNGRVYPGRGVRDGASSWLSQDRGGTAGYDKPVLIHHDGEQDAIGRINAQQYIALWEGDQFDNDWRHPDVGTKPGSGFIVLGASIADQDAQQKILDGRYRTVSTGQTSNKAACSICAADWAGRGFFEEAPCDHRPGKTYEVDGKNYLAYLVTGKMDYMECSFVNHPANELAGVVSVDGDDEHLSKDRSEWRSVDSLGSIQSLKLCDSKQGGMTELIKKDGEKDQIPYGDKNVKGKTLVSVPENLKLDPLADRTNEDLSGNNATEDQGTASPKDSGSEMTDEEFALAHTALMMHEAGLLSSNGSEDAGESDFSFDDCIELISDLQQAELSAEQRKKLRSGPFCGPNRSFPVPDCAHVDAAKQLIDLSKLSDTKCAEILSKIDKKAKRLGHVDSNADMRRKDEPAMSDDAGKTKTDDAQTKDSKEKPLSVLEQALEDSQKRCATLEADLAKKGQLYDGKVTEYNALMDENKAIHAEFQKQLASQLVQLEMQLQKPNSKSIKDESSYKAAIESKSGRSVDSLRDSISDLLPELNDSFKSSGVPTFIKDKDQGKPATQKNTDTESGNKTKKQTDKSDKVEDLI